MSSKSSEKKSGQFVLPGERLGVIEEFIPDVGTYIKEGAIYSKIVGRSLLDFLNKRVSVYPLVRGVKVPEIDSIVLGQVTRVQRQNAFVRIYKIGKNQLSGFFTCLLHISDVRLTYVDSMFNVCKPVDIIRAKVVSGRNGIYHLAIKDKKLGVVFAFCSQCGYMLERRQYKLHCPRCGKIERRKTALDYGKGVIA